MWFRKELSLLAEVPLYYKFIVSVCSLRYSACNAHAPYRPLLSRPALQYLSTFYLTNGTIFGGVGGWRGEVIKHKMCVLVFSTLSQTFLILRRNSKTMRSKMHTGIHVRYRLFLSDFSETWTFSTGFRKIRVHINFHENTFRGSRVVPCGQTDEQTWRS
jgi:hypothetical protein